MTSSVSRELAPFARLRDATPPDARTVHALVEWCELRDFATAETTKGDIAEAVGNGAAGEAQIPAVVAETGDHQIVGFATAGRLHGKAYVAGFAEGRGVGTALRRWLERQDIDLGRPAHRQEIAVDNRRAATLLCGAGYRCARSYFRMSLTLNQEIATEAPAPIRLRAMSVPADFATIHELDDLCFRENSDYLPETFTDFCAEHLTCAQAKPSLSLVAEATGGDTVGFVVNHDWGHGPGYVAILAVHPAWRRRGVGTALLTAAFAAFASVGVRKVELGVASDNLPALELYRRLGMAARQRSRVYERVTALDQPDM
jgi:ribosomal protein S18 acetylase RimI-like enzyme